MRFNHFMKSCSTAENLVFHLETQISKIEFNAQPLVKLLSEGCGSLYVRILQKQNTRMIHMIPAFYFRGSY